MAIEVGRFANVMASLPDDRAIATCPGWNVRDLAEHLGVIHRWADELVRLRSPERRPREVSDEVRAAVSPQWIEDGGRQLVATLLAADPADAMWGWGSDQHVRFWSRRQLHETLVHRMDLELAADIRPEADQKIVEDAIDEFLSNMEAIAPRVPSLSELRGHGERLGFRVRESNTRWMITFDSDRFSVSHDDSSATTELSGSAIDLLLIVLGRRRVNESDVDVVGDADLLDHWLSHSEFD
ncbi:MAG: maleylpyruvate isomerase family mycothiol-dependent enzyme [Acidimicrobiales bacterium]